MTEQKFTIQEILKHPFTGTYWDTITGSHMTFICGTLLSKVDKDGNVTPKLDKPSMQ